MQRLRILCRAGLHGPTLPSSGHLTPLVLTRPAHLSSIGNLHSLLQLGVFNQPAPVRRLLLVS